MRDAAKPLAGSDPAQPVQDFVRHLPNRPIAVHDEVAGLLADARREDGTLLSLRDGIAKHYTAAIATFETSARSAREMVRDYAAFRQRAVADGRSGTMKRVVFLPGNDPARAAELAAIPNFGRKSIQEVVDVLADRGLALKG